MSEKYHLRNAVSDEAEPLLGAAGFRRDRGALRGFDTFVRERNHDLLEAVVFFSGKRGRNFFVEIALVRPGHSPLDAPPLTSPLLDSDSRRIGVRDPLGRLVHGDPYYRGRDEWSWNTVEELRHRVRIAAELALQHGPSYWERQAKRLLRWNFLRAR